MRHLHLIAPLFLLASCAPDIPQNAPPKVVVAQFDPLASPPVLPLPNDLALDATTHRLAIPDDPGASAAQLEFNAYLRTLDGFPPSGGATATFSDAIDPASAIASSVAALGSIGIIDATAAGVLGPKDYAPVVSSDGKTLTLNPTKPWKLGHTYAVIAFGGDDPHGLKPMDTTMGGVVAAPFTFFLRSTVPLLTTCGDVHDPACACKVDPMTNTFPTTCAPALGLSFDQAVLLEGPREAVSGQIDLLLSVVGGERDRKNIVFLWSFTISTGPFAVFDPTISTVPFPNDVLVNQTTGKVNLPIDPKAPPSQQAIYMGLNKLDGFSTTAAATCPIITFDNQAPVGATAGNSVVLLDATNTATPDIVVAPELENGKDYDGLLTITPVRPLKPDLTQEVVIITNGITDSMGRALRPSPVMQFVKSRSPLFDPMTMKSNVAQLADADAAQLETLRSAYEAQNLWTILEQFGIKRDDVAMLWTYKTQSMTAALTSLASLAQIKMLPTDVKILDAEPGTQLGADVGQVVWGTMHTHLALGSDGTLDITGGKDVDIPFLMTTPKVVPVNGAPVTIVQHGLGRWRADALAIGEAFASQGWATIAIDINGHGQRSLCTQASDCAMGGTCGGDGKCSTALAVLCTDDSQCASNGMCNKMTGACSTSFAPNSSLCITHLENAQPVTECNPAASGAAFLNFANPFALRDNFRQHVLDLTQLQRVIEDTGATGLKAKLGMLAQPVAIDTTHTSYIGQSLGGIEGALFLSVSPKPAVAVLNVPGGKLVDILVTSPTFSPLVGQLVTAMGVTANTAAYFQLLNTLRWIVDPGDPINFGRYIRQSPLGTNTPKKVIVQEAGADMVIPNPWTDLLTQEIGLPLLDGGQKMHPGISAVLITDQAAGPQIVSTTFPGAAHGFIFAPGVGTVNGQTQAVTWIASDGNLISAP